MGLCQSCRRHRVGAAQNATDPSAEEPPLARLDVPVGAPVEEEPGPKAPTSNEKLPKDAPKKARKVLMGEPDLPGEEGAQ